MDKGVGKHRKVRLVAAKTEIRVYQAQLDLAQLRLQEILSVVQLYKALGGGWE